MCLVNALVDSLRWKPLEAALALLGGVSDDVRDLLETKGSEASAPIDIQFLFDQVIPGLLDQSGGSPLTD